MNLPEKNLIRDKWLHHYKSGSDQLDAIRTTALSSLDAPARSAPKGWLIQHSQWIAITACWCIALLLNFTAPEIETPAYAEKSPINPNRATRSNSVEFSAAQHPILFEYFSIETGLKTEDARLLAPENKPLRVPPPALLHKISQTNARYIV